MQPRKVQMAALLGTAILLICSCQQTTPGVANAEKTSTAADDLRLTVLTPDSVLVRHTEVKALGTGFARTETVIPFFPPSEYGTLGDVMTGCPCCPAPRHANWMLMSMPTDSLPPVPPCCIPCLVPLQEKIVNRFLPIDPLVPDSVVIATRDSVSAGIVSVYGALEIRRNSDAPDPLPMRFDITINGVKAVPLPGDAGPLTIEIPSGTRPGGRLHAVAFRRNFQVQSGVAEIALTQNMLREMKGEQITRSVLGIVFLPELR